MLQEILREGRPFTFTMHAQRSNDETQTMDLTVHVTQAMIDEATRLGLTGDKLLEWAADRALAIAEQKQTRQ